MGPTAAAGPDPGVGREAADDLAEPLAALGALIASAQQDADRTSRIGRSLEQMQAQVRDMADLWATVRVEQPPLKTCGPDDAAHRAGGAAEGTLHRRIEPRGSQATVVAETAGLVRAWSSLDRSIGAAGPSGRARAAVSCCRSAVRPEVEDTGAALCVGSPTTATSGPSVVEAVAAPYRGRHEIGTSQLSGSQLGGSQPGGQSVVLAVPPPSERAVGLPSEDDRCSSPGRNRSSATKRRALTVVICDDHRMFAESLASVLEARGHDVVACTAEPDLAVAEVAARRPDILVTDLSFPNADGVDALVAARRASPATQAIVLSGAGSQALFLQAKLAGATGCLGKHGEMGRILDAVEAVAAGDHVFDLPGERSGRGNGGSHELLRFLTERERQVLERLVQGQRTDTIAAELGMAHSTTRSHIQRVLSKLGAHSRLEAVSLATAGRGQHPTDHRKVSIPNTPNGGGAGLAAL